MAMNDDNVIYLFTSREEVINHVRSQPLQEVDDDDEDLMPEINHKRTRRLIKSLLRRGEYEAAFDGGNENGDR